MAWEERFEIHESEGVWGVEEDLFVISVSQASIEI